MSGRVVGIYVYKQRVNTWSVCGYNSDGTTTGYSCSNEESMTELVENFHSYVRYMLLNEKNWYWHRPSENYSFLFPYQLLEGG